MWWPTNQRRTVQVRRFGFSGFRRQGATSHGRRR
ncbi:hypothetical protein OROHE_018469 [Orobanche hederae]